MINLGITGTFENREKALEILYTLNFQSHNMVTILNFLSAVAQF